MAVDSDKVVQRLRGAMPGWTEREISSRGRIEILAALRSEAGLIAAEIAEDVMAWVDADGRGYMATPHAVAKEIRKAFGLPQES